MRHATECGERDVMRFVGETAGCLVEKDIELRGAVEDLDRRIEEIHTPSYAPKNADSL